MSVRERIQQAAEHDALVVGTKESLKQMDDIAFLAIAANTPPALEDRVREAAADSVEVEKLAVDNQELGSLCMKPFSASIVGVTTSR